MYRKQYPVEKMCHVLNVSRSGFYAYLTRKPSKRQARNAYLLKEIKISHQKSWMVYGSPRITAHMNNRGIAVSEATVAKLMRANNIKSITHKKFIATTDSKHNYRISDNILNTQVSHPVFTGF